MKVDGYDSLILYVGSLGDDIDLYVGTLGLPVLFEDEVLVAIGSASGRLVLHRNDRGHDERGIFPAGLTAGQHQCASTWRLRRMGDATRRGVPVLWPAQDATGGRFVVVADQTVVPSQCES